MKRNIGKQIAIMALILLCVPAWGAPVSKERARQVADGFLRTEQVMPHSGRKSARKVQAAPRQLMNDQQFYVFDTQDGGFVIIAADDCARPVLAYGEKGGALTSDKMPENLREWLEGYNYSIRKAAEDGYTASADVQAEWTALAKGKAAEATPVVGPLLTTIWDQWDGNDYYSYYTPIDTFKYEGGSYVMHVPTGCVATCMAQVMKYWNWPKQGTGSHSYLPKTHPEYGVQSADFGATTYDWSNMPDYLTNQSWMTQVQAVALLQYHCGVALNMDYSMEGSSAYSVIGAKYAGYSPAEHALCTYFGYSNSLQSYTRSNFVRTEDWTQMLKDELDAARPVMYAGGGKKEGGHSFVCCGYDSEDRFYFNFGWSGSYDGYFALDAITPGGSGTGGNAEHDYSYRQDAIIGIRPAENDAERTYDYALRLYFYDEENYATYAPSLDKDSLWWMEDGLTVSFKVANYDTLQYKGSFAAQVLDAQGRVVAISNEKTMTVDPYNYEEVTKLTIEPSLALVPGEYHVQPVYRNAGGGWTPVESRHYWADLKFTVYYWSSILAYSEMDINPDPLVQGMNANVTMYIANVTGTELSDMFVARLYTPDGQWVQDIDTVDLSTNPLQDYYYNQYAFLGPITAAPGEYILMVVYIDALATYPLGCDWYNYARRVTVISEDDVPEEAKTHNMVLESLLPYSLQTYETTIYEGDSVGVYIFARNTGLADYNGYIGVVLYDEQGNYVTERIYNAYCPSVQTVYGSFTMDTTLAAGNYYAYVFYFAEEWYVMNTIEGVDNPYLFTVLPAEITPIEQVEATGEPVRTQLYSILGQPLQTGNAAGVCIMVQTDANGNVSTKRIFQP